MYITNNHIIANNLTARIWTVPTMVLACFLFILTFNQSWDKFKLKDIRPSDSRRTTMLNI